MVLLQIKERKWQSSHLSAPEVLALSEYGIDINVGDTRGPAGIFRALRIIPVMLDICKDIEKYCPNAVFLNYTNPTAKN
jgi:alpha-galactosidase